MVQDWINEYRNITIQYPQLATYVTRSQEHIKRSPINSWLNIGILDIFYRIIAHEPFATWKNDPERTYRIGKLSKLFEAYSAVPYPSSPGSNRGYLKISSAEAGMISFGWRQNFYYSFTGLLVSEGLNDPEDEELISPPDRLPLMTVHQAKGLEFDFVFVYGVSQNLKVDDSLILEDMLLRFRLKPSLTRFSQEQRANQDLIRYHFVSYSRAKSALIHIVPKSHFKNDKFGFINKKTKEFRTSVRNLGD